jgi:hypothetical protein
MSISFIFWNTINCCWGITSRTVTYSSSLSWRSFLTLLVRLFCLLSLFFLCIFTFVSPLPPLIISFFVVLFIFHTLICLLFFSLASYVLLFLLPASFSCVFLSLFCHFLFLCLSYVFQFLCFLLLLLCVLWWVCEDRSLTCWRLTSQATRTIHVWNMNTTERESTGPTTTPTSRGQQYFHLPGRYNPSTASLRHYTTEVVTPGTRQRRFGESCCLHLQARSVLLFFCFTLLHWRLNVGGSSLTLRRTVLDYTASHLGDCNLHTHNRKNYANPHCTARIAMGRRRCC